MTWELGGSPKKRATSVWVSKDPRDVAVRGARRLFVSCLCLLAAALPVGIRLSDDGDTAGTRVFGRACVVFRAAGGISRMPV